MATVGYRRLDEKSDADGHLEPIGPPKRPGKKLTTLTITSLATNFILLCILLPLLWRELPTRNRDLKRVSLYSPILDQIDIPVAEVEHDNTLWAHSKYAHVPSKEIDALWSPYDHPRFLLVDEEDIRRVGKDPQLTVQHPEKPGKFIAMLAVDHQIHCLNGLRKNLFPDYYYPNGSSSPLHMDHLLHCVDLLHQTITCHSDTDLITANWIDVSSGATLDFKINMQCHDHEALKAWQWSKDSTFFAPEEEGFADWRRPEGAKTIVASKQWYQLMVEQGYVTAEEYRAQWGELPPASGSRSTP